MKSRDPKKPRVYGADHAADNVALSSEATGLIPALPAADSDIEGYSNLSATVKRELKSMLEGKNQ